MQKSILNYIALCALMLLAVIVANGAAGVILLNVVDDDDDGPAIESVRFQDDQQFLLLQENLQEFPQLTFQPCIVPTGKTNIAFPSAQYTLPLSTRD